MIPATSIVCQYWLAISETAWRDPNIGRGRAKLCPP